MDEQLSFLPLDEPLRSRRHERLPLHGTERARWDLLTYPKYHRDHFLADLAEAVIASPSPHQEHEPDVVIVQPKIIMSRNPTVAGWSGERRDLFAVALFFAVLLDQRYREHWPPSGWPVPELSWTGDCLAMCLYELEPVDVLALAGQRRRRRSLDPLLPRLAEAAPSIEREGVAWLSQQREKSAEAARQELHDDFARRVPSFSRPHG